MVVRSSELRAQAGPPDEVTGLKGLAMMGVVWVHAARGQATSVLYTPGMGVTTMFVVSAFLLTAGLLRRGVAADPGFLEYYVRRVVRLLPLYYLTLAGYAGLVAHAEQDPVAATHFWQNLPAFVTVTSNLFVPLEGRVIFAFAWSMAAQLQFILILPLIYRRGLGVGGAAFGIAALGHLGVLQWLGVPQRVLEGLVHVSPALAVGMVVAHLLHRPKSRNILRLCLGRGWVAPTLLGAVVAIPPLAGWGEVSRLPAMALLVGLLVVSLRVRPATALAPLLGHRWLVRAGEASLGLFLFNMLAVNAAERLLTPAGAHPGAIFGAALVLAYLAARASQRYFETPLARWGASLFAEPRSATNLAQRLPLPGIERS